MKHHLTTDQLRRIVFETSVAYAAALRKMSVQAAEWVRTETLKRELVRLRGRQRTRRIW